MSEKIKTWKILENVNDNKTDWSKSFRKEESLKKKVEIKLKLQI